MLYIHPAIMLCVIFLVVHVAKLGLVRTATTRFGREGVFPWKEHVLRGKIAMAGLAAGACGAALVAWKFYPGQLKTGQHSILAWVILALAVSGFASGLMLDARRGPRNVISLAHGAGNLVLAVLTLAQISTGVEIILDFLW